MYPTTPRCIAVRKLRTPRARARSELSARTVSDITPKTAYLPTTR